MLTMKKATNGKVGTRRRHVTNEEMEVALKNTDNTNIIRSVLFKYKDLINEDDLETCGLSGLWRALGYFRPEYGKKFTTNLYQFVHFECRRELRKQKNHHKGNVGLNAAANKAEAEDVECPEDRLAIRHMEECMLLLSREQRDLLHSYYYDNFTVDELSSHFGYSKETVRHKINWAELRLRELCDEIGEPVYSVQE